MGRHEDVADGEPTVDDVVAALEDERCRAIVAALDEPRSAGTLSERADIPLSTTYRKLERLEAAGLVTTRTAYRADGHHTEQYALDFAAVRIARAGSGDLVAAVEGPREPEEQLAAMWTAVSNEA